MTARATSITGRLIVTLTVGTTILWLVAAAVSSSTLRHELDESSDRALSETAHRLLPLAIDSRAEGETEGESDEVHEIQHFQSDEEHGLPYQLRLADGRMILRSDDAPQAPFDETSRSGFSNTAEYRVFTLLDPNSQVAIQVGDSLAKRQRAVMGSTISLFLPLLLLVPLSIAGIWFAIRRGLRPLTVLQAEIAARDSANLTPLALEGLPRELLPIGSALSRLIERLRGAFEAEREFAANSAHELRTPIAGALAQTQRLIETTSDERTRAEGRKIEATLRRLADLAERLMQLARADSGMASSTEPVAILPVVRLVLADAKLRSGQAHDFELIAAPGSEATTVRINVDALGIVLRNLIDNAVLHSPPDSRITVEVSGATISVRNASPVLPPEVIDRLRRRFERGPTAASGSGLGLAIVDTILSQVGGSLTLYSPARGLTDGFEALVELPPAAAA